MYVQVPLHDVTAMGVLLNRIPAFFIPATGRSGRRRDLWIRALKERPRTRVLDGSRGDEGKLLGGRGNILVGHRQDIEHPEAAAHSRLAVVEGGPGKSDARFE